MYVPKALWPVPNFQIGTESRGVRQDAAWLGAVERRPVQFLQKGLWLYRFD